VKQRLRAFIIFLICNTLIFSPVVSAAEALALPGSDLIAPEIKQQQIPKNLPAGDLPTITATVTDNVGVKDVTVFYRQIGASDFARVEMKRNLSTTEYSITLPEIFSPGVEYYIQASDQAGNTVLHGHTFSPLTIAVLPDPTGTNPDLAGLPSDTISTETGNEVANQPAKSKISKWVWIGLGVIAVGALAGGGSSGGGGEEPTTGTVTITGSTP